MGTITAAPTCPQSLFIIFTYLTTLDHIVSDRRLISLIGLRRNIRTFLVSARSTGKYPCYLPHVVRSSMYRKISAIPITLALFRERFSYNNLIFITCEHLTKSQQGTMYKRQMIHIILLFTC